MHDNISYEEGVFCEWCPHRNFCGLFFSKITLKLESFNNNALQAVCTVWRQRLPRLALPTTTAVKTTSDVIQKTLKFHSIDFNLRQGENFCARFQSSRININSIKKFMFFFEYKKRNERWYTRILHKRNLCESYFFFFRILSLKREMMFEFV